MSLQNMAKLAHDLFELCRSESIEVEQMGAINDMIMHQYLVET